MRSDRSLRIATLLSLAGACPSAFAAGFPATPEDLKGMASLVCSGALVRLGRGANQSAVLLTNGHCASNKSIDPEDALVNVPYERGEIAVYFGGEAPEAVKPARVLYATRTGTDVALIELKATYAQLEKKGAKVYEVADTDAKAGTDVQLVSGFWKEKQLCAISHVVEALREDAWTTKDSYAMKEPCPSQGGWFGTPMLDPTTMKIVGILNTANMAGQLCTLDNPCEVQKDGTQLAFNGRTYGQRTSMIGECLNGNGNLDLNRSTCKLQKPKVRTRTPEPAPSSSPTPPKPAKPKSSWPKSKPRG